MRSAIGGAAEQKMKQKFFLFSLLFLLNFYGAWYGYQCINKWAGPILSTLD